VTRNAPISCATALALLAGLLLTGDIPASAQQRTAADPAEPAQAARRKPTSGAFIGKPTAPIGVTHKITGEPALGQPLTIRITAHPGAGVAGLALDVRAGDELAVGPVTEAVAVASGDRAWTVTVTPLTVAPARLDVFVTGLLNGEPQTRSLAIPIRVGGAKPVPGNAAIKADEFGEAIVVLPAEVR
jgi:hypothetical protein